MPCLALVQREIDERASARPSRRSRRDTHLLRDLPLCIGCKGVPLQWDHMRIEWKECDECGGSGRQRPA